MLRDENRKMLYQGWKTSIGSTIGVHYSLLWTVCSSVQPWYLHVISVLVGLGMCVLEYIRYFWIGGRERTVDSCKYSTAKNQPRHLHLYRINAAPSLPTEIVLRTESIEWFIEDQAFSRSYDLAPPIPPSPVSKLDWWHTESLVLYK
jgi:hypothetical protein